MEILMEMKKGEEKSRRDKYINAFEVFSVSNIFWYDTLFSYNLHLNFLLNFFEGYLFR